VDFGYLFANLASAPTEIVPLPPWSVVAPVSKDPIRPYSVQKPQFVQSERERSHPFPDYETERVVAFSAS
jgi:hypothetical protein